MTFSFPSKPIHVFDSPEVSSIDATFYYNFFSPNEKIDESGFKVLDSALTADLKRPGSPDFRNSRASVPRFNVLRINYTDKVRMMDKKVARGSDLTATKKELESAIANGLVVTETNATSKIYNAMTLGDAGINDEVENVMRLALNKYIVHGLSPSTAVDHLSAETLVDSDMLSRMLPPSLNDIVKSAEDSHKPLSTDEGNFDKNRAQAQINASFAPMMLRKSVVRGTSLLDGYINSNYMTAASFVKSTPSMMSKLGSTPGIGEDESLFDIPFFRRPEFIPDGKVVSAESGVAGILVEKTRILNGKRYRMPSIIVPGLRPNLVLDTKIAYGQTYEYSIRTLSIFKVPISTTEGNKLLATYLVASKPSQPVQTVTTENRPPNPPSDIDFFYNYEDNTLTVFWKPPVNPQQDVKYYQVFRRKSLSEPFELLAMMDFDNSIIRSEPVETIDPSLVRASPYPVMKYIDSEFNREGDFIYAVMAVDARQLSSLYSTQVHVKFDNAKNRINKRLVCRQGAPKQYPNWTKEENFFVDTMKDSAHSKVQIYFDPEAYTVIDSGGVKTPLFLAKSHDESAKYVFQFINTDRVLEQRFEVKIDDQSFAEDGGYDSLSQGLEKRADQARVETAPSKKKSKKKKRSK